MLQTNLHSVPKKLILLQGIDLGRGEINVMGGRMMLLPVEILAEMVHRSGNSPEVAQLLYESCRVTTEDHYRYMKEKKGMGEKELLDWSKELMGFIGWGKGRYIESGVTKGNLCLEMENSSVAVEYLKKYGKSEKPVCHMLCGGAAGILNAVNGRSDMVTVETACLAKGDPKCVIIGKPRSQLAKEGKK